jgi:hypothetical protein
MKSIPRQQIIRALSQKGFVIVEKKRHTFLVFMDSQGRQSSIRTFLSRGGQYKDYTLSLLKAMKNELKLSHLHQLEDLIACPLSEADYRSLLIMQGIEI